jgi:hypothetical protein
MKVAIKQVQRFAAMENLQKLTRGCGVVYEKAVIIY